MKMNRIACAKCCPSITVTANATTDIAMNPILIHFMLSDAPFLNLRENIGISLIISTASTTEDIGMIYVSCSIAANDITP